MDNLCIRCKGKGLCGQGQCRILSRFQENAPKPKLHFSGKSAPELFIGRIGYPYVNCGILTPQDNDNLANFATAEEWSRNNFSISNVLRLRGQLIYGRGKSNIKVSDRLKAVTQELALSSTAVSTEIFLKKKPTLEFTGDSIFRPMTNPAPIRKAILEENVRVSRKVDYLVNDSDVLSVEALKELYFSGSKVDHLQKLLSVGLLGRRIARRMVPTRWSITATDDNVCKEILKKVRFYPENNRIMVFSGNFVGNYVEALIFPGSWTFEAIECWGEGSVYSGESVGFSQDYEGFRGRKGYATNITGGYYAMRLPVVEYLEKVGRQATVLVFREIREEYYAPLGVGIVRETTRRAMNNSPKYFDSITEALKDMQSRINVSIYKIIDSSWVLKNYGKQKTLTNFF